MPSPEYIRGAPGLYKRGTTNQDAERQQDTLMALIGNLHPLLVHFPIALVMAAAAAELVAIATPREAWHTVAVVNLRAGAAIGVATAVTGWVLAASTSVDATSALEWHRWIGMAGAAGALGAALLPSYRHVPSRRFVVVYRVALFGAACLVALTGHLGGTIVWGAEFFRP
jgi:uncharacterized membrane protein